jgi:hypothetical protein
VLLVSAVPHLELQARPSSILALLPDPLLYAVAYDAHCRMSSSTLLTVPARPLFGQPWPTSRRNVAAAEEWETGPPVLELTRRIGEMRTVGASGNPNAYNPR